MQQTQIIHPFFSGCVFSFKSICLRSNTQLKYKVKPIFLSLHSVAEKKSKNITKPEKSRTKLQPSIRYMTLQILVYFPKGTFLNKTKENQSKQQLGTCHLQKFKTINKLSTHLSTKKNTLS